MTELGRAVAPVPFLTSAVVATLAVLPSGDESLLGGLAAGTTTAALVVPLTAGAVVLGRPRGDGRPGLRVGAGGGRRARGRRAPGAGRRRGCVVVEPSAVGCARSRPSSRST